MKAARKLYPAIFLIMVMCLLCAAMPVWASALSNEAPAVVIGEDPPPLASQDPPDYQQMSIPELYAKVKECRQSLLETRLNVVKEANEAKLRLEELLKNNKQGMPSAEALKKDLETIKEAQRVLATILSDIVSAAAGMETGAGDANKSQGWQPGGTPGTQQEIMPSREHLESLIVLYDQKTKQLAKIVESLNGIVVLI